MDGGHHVTHSHFLNIDSILFASRVARDKQYDILNVRPVFCHLTLLVRCVPPRGCRATTQVLEPESDPTKVDLVVPSLLDYSAMTAVRPELDSLDAGCNCKHVVSGRSRLLVIVAGGSAFGVPDPRTCQLPGGTFKTPSSKMRIQLLCSGWQTFGTIRKALLFSSRFLSQTVLFFR